jgi:Txe/YoeB family toxin of Txe-Axe toxin-antitoxin module
MPKADIDYSNTVIYKIFCKDETICDMYIGHTTNFTKRKYQHKISCNSGNKFKIYEIIRANGGWENWDMVEVATYNCKNATEARIKEQEHYELTKSSLNSCSPYVNKEKYYCSICKVQSFCEKNFTEHTKCARHLKLLKESELTEETHGNSKSAENAKFFCNLCDFKCCKNSEWLRHVSTQKHISRLDGNFLENAEIKKCADYICECGKKYETKSGLWKHQKTCKIEKKDIKEEEIAAMKEIMKYLMKENSEMKTMMMEQHNTMMEQQTMMLEVVKNGTTNHSHNTTHTNSHNKAFNLQFFLNETCKDAMNIGEFVDSLKLQLSDLEKVGEAGYIEGITSIIVKNLKELDITKRPVHCTDKKRETVYIKDADKWEKDDDKTQMHKLIKRIASKNMKMFEKYREVHPDCLKYHSKYCDQYNKIVYESMGGKGDNDFEKNEKIIKNVLKEVIIDKNL